MNDTKTKERVTISVGGMTSASRVGKVQLYELANR